jgi:hypothetical protein
MNDKTDHTTTIRVDDEVLFRLSEGRIPLVYSDTVARVSYATGVNVLHTGTVWAFGEFEGIEALELDDGTVVALADIDSDSVIVNLTRTFGDPS